MTPTNDRGGKVHPLHTSENSKLYREPQPVVLQLTICCLLLQVLKMFISDLDIHD